MKIIKTYSGDEYPVADDECANVKSLADDPTVSKDSFVDLRTGESIRLASIEAFKNPALVARYRGYPITKDKLYFIEDGEKIAISRPQDIEYVEDPKYKKILEKLGTGNKELT